MKTFLFQGDSITDAIRSRDTDRYLGHGYTTMTAGALSLRHVGEYKFLNRGVSGNRVVDLYARIRQDVILLKPDIMTVLIGVNDVWHEVAIQNGVSAPKFEKVYNLFMEEVLEALPDIKIFILEPFVQKGEATIEHWDYFHDETLLRAQAAKRVAERFNMPFVPLQAKLDAYYDQVPVGTVLFDGVHPHVMVHQIISNALVEAVEPYM